MVKEANEPLQEEVEIWYKLGKLNTPDAHTKSRRTVVCTSLAMRPQITKICFEMSTGVGQMAPGPQRLCFGKAGGVEGGGRERLTRRARDHSLSL